MLVDVYTKEGQINGQIELQDNIFGIEPNENAMHQAVVAYLAHQRQGTRKTKIRSEVSGGGKKPWGQKGRGTARSGSSRSPLWSGGGTVHGPKPFEYKYKLPKKLNRLARKSALSLRVSESNIIIIEDFQLTEIKTKNVINILSKLNLSKEKSLLLLPDTNDKIFMSGRNISNLTIQLADKISTYDILNHKKILIFKEAISTIEKTFSN